MGRDSKSSPGTTDTGESEPHVARVPEALETIVARLGELRVMFGPEGGQVMEAVDADLREALAARERGETTEAVGCIGRAMTRLVHLTERLDPSASGMMRALIAQFGAALGGGRENDARRAAESMREMSGAKVIDGDD